MYIIASIIPIFSIYDASVSSNVAWYIDDCLNKVEGQRYINGEKEGSTFVILTRMKEEEERARRRR